MSLKSTCPGRHRSALKALRISARKLYIETGKHKKYDKVSKIYINTSREDRTCSACTSKIEDEYHFLLECSKKLDLRRNCLESIKGNGYCFGDLDDKIKTILLFINKDESIICQLARFIND